MTAIFSTSTEPHGRKHMNSAKLIRVIVTESVRGKGTTDNLSRIVTEYWALDGVLLATVDPCDPVERVNIAISNNHTATAFQEAKHE